MMDQRELHCPASVEAAANPTTQLGDSLMDGFVLKAVVDWVELKLTLSKPTQARHLRHRMPPRWGLPYARPDEDQDANSCTVFYVRVQDPDLGRLPQEVASLQGEAQVVAIEVALDAYPRTPAASSLYEAALHLYRHQALPPPGPRRITEPGRYRAAASARDMLLALQQGVTINMGDEQAPYRGRCYVKCHDTIDGQAYAWMEVSHHRARLERTLSAALCPVGTLVQLQRFRFEQLARYFAMVLPVRRSSRGQLLLPVQGLLGVRAGSLPKRRRVRMTRRDAALNARIRYALRQLTDRCATQVRRAEIRGHVDPTSSVLVGGDGSHLEEFS